MAYPVASVIFPSVLSGLGNGLLPASLLYPVAGGRLTRNASIAFNAMNAEAIAAGYPLSASSSANTYRDLATQQSYWYERYDNVYRAGAETHFYQGKQWWKKPGATTAAVPGQSNHGWGLAIDLQSASGGRLTWLLNNAARFGFSWEIQSEPWHLRYILGDALPMGITGNDLQPVSNNPLTPAASSVKDFDMSTTTTLPLRRPGSLDDNPVHDFTWLRAHGESVGANYEVISQLFIRQLVRDNPARDKIITVWFAGTPVPVLLTRDGATSIVEVQRAGMCSIGDHTGAFQSDAAVGVYVEARETILPK